MWQLGQPMKARMDDGIIIRNREQCSHDVLNIWVFQVGVKITNDDQSTPALRTSNMAWLQLSLSTIFLVRLFKKSRVRRLSCLIAFQSQQEIFFARKQSTS